MSQEEPFHVDMASTRDDDVAKCAAEILERFSRLVESSGAQAK